MEKNRAAKTIKAIRTIKKIKNINVPILVMHGKKDNVVPFKMGVKLFDNANQPKFSYFSDIDDHMMEFNDCLLYTSPSPRDRQKSRMPSSA